MNCPVPANATQKLSFGARILLLFSRAPNMPDYPMIGIHYDTGKELDRLVEVFPNIRDEITGKIVVDFGCGLGYQTTALALAGAKHAIGIDIVEVVLEQARQRAARMGVSDKVTFAATMPKGICADVIVSQNSFEHFTEAAGILAGMRASLASGGKLFVTFSPPWYAPWGAHTAYFCRLPWVQLFFSERSVMQVRSLFRSDGKTTYEEAGLAKMSLFKFERLIASSGLRSISTLYECSWKLHFLRRTPLREFFVNRVSCILTPINSLTRRPV